jgi:hypothetical protein
LERVPYPDAATIAGVAILRIQLRGDGINEADDGGLASRVVMAGQGLVR